MDRGRVAELEIYGVSKYELSLAEKAIELFRFATRIDLDNYKRNTAEGLYMTSIAGA